MSATPAAASPIHVWSCGDYLSGDQISIPLASQTWQQGVGVFETLRVVRGEAPWLLAHTTRLEQSCRRLGLPIWPARWHQIIRTLARAQEASEGVARISIGDGFALVTFRPLPPQIADEARDGVALASVVHTRALADVKSVSRLPLWLAERAHGGREVVLQSADGELLESSRANLFRVCGRVLETTPVPAVLPGIARARVLRIARESGLEVRFRAPHRRELDSTSELFLTNAVRGIRPIRALDTLRLEPPSADSVTRLLQSAIDTDLGLR